MGSQLSKSGASKGQYYWILIESLPLKNLLVMFNDSRVPNNCKASPDKEKLETYISNNGWNDNTLERVKVRTVVIGAEIDKMYPSELSGDEITKREIVSISLLKYQASAERTFYTYTMYFKKKKLCHVTITYEYNMARQLLVDNKSNRVLFIEAKKDFVDFLLALSTLPLGSITRFLTTKDMVGAFGDSYDSVENLEDAYMHPTSKKTPS
ncbi:hypothetical protein Sjap_003132 [Stephania japonica]|uniref:Uncharacterized protein n=1 Tax=Stephania japonica TaxID=461633 RepID=A0AAP0KN55_9MAGN